MMQFFVEEPDRLLTNSKILMVLNKTLAIIIF